MFKECELRLYELNFSLETRLKEAQQQLKQTMNQLNQQREFLAELKIQSPPLEHVIRMDKRHENYQGNWKWNCCWSGSLEIIGITLPVVFETNRIYQR